MLLRRAVVAAELKNGKESDADDGGGGRFLFVSVEPLFVLVLLLLLVVIRIRGAVVVLVLSATVETLVPEVTVPLIDLVMLLALVEFDLCDCCVCACD